MPDNDIPSSDDLNQRVAAFLDAAGEPFSGAYLLAIDGVPLLRGARGFAKPRIRGAQPAIDALSH